MLLANLQGQEPAPRYLSGGRVEAEGLFGTPLPALPAPETDGGRSVYYVRFHPSLKPLVQRYLQALLAQLGLATPGAPSADHSEQAQNEFAAAFTRVLQAVMLSDRRQGLLNLCWLAHSKDVAETLRQLEQKTPNVRKHKYLLGPHLTTLYRRIDQAARKAADQADPGRADFLLGRASNPALVDAVIDDGFAFTEGSFAELDLKSFIGQSRKHRLTAEVFFEWLQALTGEVERRLKEGDRGLLARLARHLPALGRDQQATPAGLTRIALNAPVLSYLLADAWGTGARLQGAARLRSEADRRRSAEMVDALLELVDGVKRFEAMSAARDLVSLVPALPPAELEDHLRRCRVYDFSESPQVLNNAVYATVLFLDLRGFTETSEGYISARDLTRELYAVFDSFVPHIRRFGGTVDKFLGDGIMVTFGTEREDPRGPLNALRAAILCQESIIRLRRQHKTAFRMGVSVHYGRVYVARFVADEDAVQTTVIGRNVNIAGRLSSAAKKPKDEEGVEDSGAYRTAQAELQVILDADGTLVNEGIVLSRDGLVQLEAEVPLSHPQPGETSVMEYYDPEISRRMLIRYAGDAKFKGVGSSFPAYEVDFVR